VAAFGESFNLDAWASRQLLVARAERRRRHREAILPAGSGTGRRGASRSRKMTGEPILLDG
jgi:hypothetical protein